MVIFSDISATQGDVKYDDGQGQLINTAVRDNRAPRDVGADYDMLGGKTDITPPHLRH